MAHSAPLLPGLTAWIVTDGKAGDLAPCVGLASALGLNAESRIIHPRLLYAALAPWGPVDPRERFGVQSGPLAGSLPDIAIASGRRAVPVLRHLRRASKGGVFTIFLKDPRIAPGFADVVWTASHDGLSGENVITSISAPHAFGARRLAALRANPDPRLTALPAPRLALLIGGDSRHHRFSPADGAALAAIADQALTAGMSLMVTPSRRTPPGLIRQLEAALAGKAAFIWDGFGANPYADMLALADQIIVTADSTNMVGEAAACGVPMHVLEPSGGHPRLTAFLDAMVATGAVRRWSGAFTPWQAHSFDPTPEIAAEIAKRWHMRAF